MTNNLHNRPELELLTIKEASQYLRISENTIRKLINLRIVPVIRMGKDIRISKQLLIDNLEYLAIQNEKIEF